MKITKEQKDVFLNLYNLYLYDLSPFTGDEIKNDGKYDPTNTYLYVERDELHPYFIQYNDMIVGFVLLCSAPYVPEGIDFSIQELFVLKKYRGMNVAAQAVSLVLQQFSGRIAVAQLKNNEAALRFWRKYYKEQNISFVEEEETIEIEGLAGMHTLITQSFDIRN